VLDRVLDFSQSLWLLAFVIYLADATRLIEPGQLLLLERSRGRLQPILARVPFEVARQELYFPGALQPVRGVFLSRWIGTAPAAALALDRLEPLRNKLLIFRIISASNMALLFLAAPILTHVFGLGAALRVVAPLVYLQNILAGSLLLANGKSLGLSRTSAAWLYFDSLLCAPYGANWVKRIARRQPPLQADVTELAERFPVQSAARIRAVLDQRRAEVAAE